MDEMVALSAAVVCTFDAAPGVTLAAVWDGGKWARIHHVSGGCFGAVVERWNMVNNRTGCPGIEHTPAALAELVRYRLEHHGQAVELAALTAERPAEKRLPAFSRN
jgi:hypothetical protein